jgi:hypothetical protein
MFVVPDFPLSLWLPFGFEVSALLLNDVYTTQLSLRM